MFTWKCSGKEAEAFVKIIKPYLVQKNEEAEVFLKFRNTITNQGNGKLSDKVINLREWLYFRIKKGEICLTQVDP